MTHEAKLPGVAAVYIVDHDEQTRLSLARLFKHSDIETRCFGSAAELLGSADLEGAGCLLLDANLRDMNGLDLQQRLAAQDCAMPIVFMTSEASVAIAVEAMKRGACDFLLKPLEKAVVLDAVHCAMQRNLAARPCAAERDLTKRLIKALTPREREVMEYVVMGETNKQIAHRLEVSEMMVKLHRSRMMKKMGAGSLVQLIRMHQLI